MDKKSQRNKTIDFTLDGEEGKKYAAQSLRLGEKKASLEEVMDRVILGDSLKIMDQLPRGFADLLIVDPPYNLAKDYHGNQFLPKSWEEYREYTVKWLEKALPLLKPDRKSVV